MHRIRRAAAGGRIAPQPDDAHIEGFGELGETSANLPQADDEERFAAKLVLPLRGIADHAAPDALCLVVARLGKPAAQCEDEGHRVLRDRSDVDAAGIGKADAALRQLFMGELVSAGADRLDEAELLRAIEKTVLPQPGDHEHIGLFHPILQGLGIADGEAIDAGVEGGKPLIQPIGDVGEADRKLIGGGKHGRTPFDDRMERTGWRGRHNLHPDTAASEEMSDDVAIYPDRFRDPPLRLSPAHSDSRPWIGD